MQNYQLSLLSNKINQEQQIINSPQLSSIENNYQHLLSCELDLGLSPEPRGSFFCKNKLILEKQNRSDSSFSTNYSYNYQIKLNQSTTDIPNFDTPKAALGGQEMPSFAMDEKNYHIMNQIAQNERVRELNGRQESYQSYKIQIQNQQGWWEQKQQQQKQNNFEKAIEELKITNNCQEMKTKLSGYFSQVNHYFNSLPTTTMLNETSLEEEDEEVGKNSIRIEEEVSFFQQKIEQEQGSNLFTQEQKFDQINKWLDEQGILMICPSPVREYYDKKKQELWVGRNRKMSIVSKIIQKKNKNRKFSLSEDGVNGLDLNQGNEDWINNNIDNEDEFDIGYKEQQIQSERYLIKNSKMYQSRKNRAFQEEKKHKVIPGLK